ncbi:MAG: hypothetical protein WD154_07815 [Nitrosopumilaceae archaeon]
MKFSKIDSSYLKKGCRLVWHDPAKDKEQVIFLRNEDLKHLYDVLSKNSTDKIELEDETSSIMINSDMVEFYITGKKPLEVEPQILKEKIAEFLGESK